MPESGEGASEAVRCGTTSTLTAGDLEQLHDTYMELIPRYKYLCEAYDKAEQKAKNLRQKSSFPSRKEWMPPFPLSEGDKELLLGPGNSITAYKRLHREDSNTKRINQFVSSENESSTSRTACSYVQIISDVIRVGRISRLMQHSFGGTLYDLAIIQEYHDKHVDTDSQLLYTDPNKSSTVIMPLSSLSPPLHVAIEREHNKLWFLNASLDQ